MLVGYETHDSDTGWGATVIPLHPCVHSRLIDKNHAMRVDPARFVLPGQAFGLNLRLLSLRGEHDFFLRRNPKR